MRRVVIDLASERAVWQVPPETVAAIRKAFGRGWEVVLPNALTKSDSDGGSGSPEAVAAVHGAEVYFGFGVSTDLARSANGSLRWVHSASAGVGSHLTPEFRATGARLTNSRAVYGEAIADWILTAIGFCVRGFHRMVANQRENRWSKDEFTDGRSPTGEMVDARVGLVGLGGIGQAVAWRCRALGIPVRAVRRRPRLRKPAGVSWVGGPQDVRKLASSSDVLVVTAPLTPETQRLIDAQVIAAMPKDSFLINVARGALVDETALLAALDSGRLGGCVLDVFSVEPLPADHPFWRHPRVLVSPHVSGASNRFWQRETDLILDNISRYLKGKRLRNQVDMNAGY